MSFLGQHGLLIRLLHHSSSILAAGEDADVRACIPTALLAAAGAISLLLIFRLLRHSSNNNIFLIQLVGNLVPNVCILKHPNVFAHVSSCLVSFVDKSNPAPRHVPRSPLVIQFGCDIEQTIKALVDPAFFLFHFSISFHSFQTDRASVRGRLVTRQHGFLQPQYAYRQLSPTATPTVEI